MLRLFLQRQQSTEANPEQKPEVAVKEPIMLRAAVARVGIAPAATNNLQVLSVLLKNVKRRRLVILSSSQR